MNDEINFEARNGLTEYRNNYRFINSPLWYCYIGLDGKLGQLSNYIFCKILDSRLYGEKAKTKNNEEKRIYTDGLMTIESISRDISPYVNYDDPKKIVSAKTNMPRKIKELDDLNIFYHWKYRDYFIFVMERDFGCWKYYNPKGYVTPKTIKKLVALSGDMIEHMVNLAKRKYFCKNIEEDIRRSYGIFLRRMIGKMNPLVTHTLPLWTNESLGDYLKQLKGALDRIHDHAGLVQDERFMKNLPFIVAKKLGKYIENVTQKHSKSTENTMIKEIQKEKTNILESELVPKDQNIVKKRRERKKRSIYKNKDVFPESSEPKLYRYDEDVDPFKDAKIFMKYYRAFLTMKFMKSVKFDRFENDAIYAAQILDLLAVNNRSDKIFLNGWLSYFCEHKLKGAKAYKIQYTSMKVLKDTFVEFNPLFPYVDV